MSFHQTQFVYSDYAVCVCMRVYVLFVQKFTTVTLPQSRVSIATLAPGTSRQTHAVVMLLSCCSPYAHTVTPLEGRRMEGDIRGQIRE